MASEEFLPVQPVRTTPKPGWARFHLRDATAASHQGVDTAFAGFDLAETSGYGAFLATQLACVRPLEAALTAAGAGTLLPDWPTRHRAPLLEADLAELGALPPPRDEPSPRLAGAGAVLGAIYVLEGSRFGGATLARRLAPSAPARFLGAAAHPQAWRTLIAGLDHHLAPKPELEAAIAAARAVFAAFEGAARRRLEPGLA